MPHKIAYLAFVLDERSVRELLARFPPKFQNVAAHHVTILPAIDPVAHAPIINKMFLEVKQSEELRVMVEAYAVADGIEAVQVRLGYNIVREVDGLPHHVTLSYENGLRAVKANSLAGLYCRADHNRRVWLSGQLQILIREE